MATVANAYERYKQQGIMTASPVDLIVMLYDECIKQLRLASTALGRRNYADANNSFKRAQDILVELMSSLDLKFDISKDLMSLYEYMIHEIVNINVRKDASGIQPIVEMLESLREAWAQIRRQQPARSLLE
jgi:flagellar protein FliS